MSESQSGFSRFMQKVKDAIAGSDETARELRETRETVTTMTGDLAQDPARRDVGEPGAGSPPGEGAEQP
jgi:hypothetical protein